MPWVLSLVSLAIALLGDFGDCHLGMAFVKFSISFFKAGDFMSVYGPTRLESFQPTSLFLTHISDDSHILSHVLILP
ncbi:hypothetical protein C8J56DRAFT_1057784 [Mycena floridula]|nr:hypothetical protein C8J56DRAFT_1057784 [Mycena floridula]